MLASRRLFADIPHSSDESDKKQVQEWCSIQAALDRATANKINVSGADTAQSLQVSCCAMDDRAAVQGALLSSQPPLQREEAEIRRLGCEFDHFHSYSVKVIPPLHRDNYFIKAFNSAEHTT